MRDLLTGVAVVLILALCAVLAVPYFVDWQARRGEVESVLAQALGLPVETRGAIRVRVLPSPVLVLDDVTLGGRGAARLAAGGLAVELAASPLLKGEIRFVEATLTRPVLTAVVGDDGSLSLPVPHPPRGPDASAIAIERLAVVDGSLRLVDRAGRELRRIDRIAAEVQAATLAGPWRVDGTADGRPMRLSTGTLGADGSLRIKAGLGGERDTRWEADGTATFAATGGGIAAPAFSGRLTMTTPLRLPAGERPASLLTVNAQVTGKGRALSAETVEVEAGEPGNAVKLTGAGSLTLGADAGLDLSLGARRIDLAGLSERIGEDGLSLTRAIVGVIPAAMPAKIALTLGSVTYGEEEASNVEAVLSREGARLRIEHLNAGLAGGASLALSGTLGLGSAPDVAGHVVLRSPAPIWLARALARQGLAPTLADALARARDIALETDFAASSAVTAVRNLRLAAGDTRLSGMLRYTPPEAGARGRFDAQIVADSLDLGSLPALDQTRSALAGLDLGLMLDARSVRFGEGQSAGLGRIQARILADATALTIERIEATNLGGANLAASGRVDADGGRIAGRIEAAATDGLALLAGRFLPADAGDLVARVARHSAPLRLDVSVDQPAAGAPMALRVAGTAAATKVDGMLRLPPAGGATGGEGAAALSLSLDASDSVALLRQIGVDALPIAGSGPGRLVVTARGASLADLPGTLRLEAAGAVLAGEGRLQLAAEATRAQGRVTLETRDAASLAQVLARPLPGLTPRTPLKLAARATWTRESLVFDDLAGQLGTQAMQGSLSFAANGRVEGRLSLDRLALADLAALALGPDTAAPAGRLWSSARFGAFAPPVEGRIGLAARQLDLFGTTGLDEVRLTLNLSPDTVALQEIAGRLGEGRVTGEATVRRAGSQASLAGKLVGTDMPAAAVFGPGGEGRLTGKLEFGAAGESPASLVANLAGGGDVRIDAASLPRLDPGAVARTLVRLVREDPVRSEAQQVRDALAPELDKAPWRIAQAASPLTLAAGSLRFGPLALAADSADAQIAGTLDLGTMTLEARGTLVARAAPPGWTGAPPTLGLAWRGPVAAPRRDIEVAALANGLATVSLTRELERIEAFEADARERAMHNRRLRAERERREAEARAAEEARRAEADARRREQDRLRSIIEQDLQPPASPQPVSPPAASPPATLPLGARTPDAPALAPLPPPLDIRAVPAPVPNPTAP